MRLGDEQALQIFVMGEVGVGVISKFCPEMQLHHDAHHAMVHALSQPSLHFLLLYFSQCIV